MSEYYKGESDVAGDFGIRPIAPVQAGKYEVRLARTPEEVAAAQKLRYRVMYQEKGGRPDLQKVKLEADVDQWDERAFHIIFNTIGDWMAGIGFLAPASGPFREYGGVTVGSVELVASGLVLLPRTRAWGALIGIGVISGAIFFHLFTPLGVDRVVDAEGHTDGGVLFMMACGVWVACAALIAIHRRTLPIIGRAGH